MTPEALRRKRRRELQDQAPANHRVCGCCHETKPLDAFPSYNKYRCRACQRDNDNRTRLKQRDKGLARTSAKGLFRVHKKGLDLLAERQGGCAICKHGGDLYLDHDHDTGLPRGLLCLDCNFGVGQLRDDADLASAAADYLMTVLRKSHLYRMRQSTLPYSSRRRAAGAYKAWIESIGGSRCQITKSRDRLHIDHDHKCGTVRGLIVGNVNQAIGHFRERPDLLRRAGEYLRYMSDPLRQRMLYEGLRAYTPGKFNC